MEKDGLGKIYQDGQSIVEQNDTGNCMYVIQSGTTEVVINKNGKEVFLSKLSEGDFLGEMAIFEPARRIATIRAKGEARVLTVDKKTLLRRIKQDPTLAFRIIETMSKRIRKLDHDLSRIKSSDRRNWDERPDSYEKPAGSS